MEKVKFRFHLHMSAKTLNTGSEIVKIEDNCAWITKKDAQAFLANSLGELIEGSLSDEIPENVVEEEISTTPAADNKEILKGLLKKSVSELQKIAVEFELPSEEWADLNKTHLVNYLIEKAFNTTE